MGGLKKSISNAARHAFPQVYLRYRLGRGIGLEPELALIPFLCNRRLRSIDVGAHIGVYVHHMLMQSLEVHAFEPNPRLCQFLKRTFRRRVHVEPVALSDRPGVKRLAIPPNSLAQGSIEIMFENASYETVFAKRLDDYRFNDVGFIKIDVEGHEISVLRGASKLLRRHKPNVLVEAEERHRKGAVAEVTRFMAEHGYEGYFYGGGELIPIDRFDPAVHQNPASVVAHGHTRSYVNNFIFVQ